MPPASHQEVHAPLQDLRAIVQLGHTSKLALHAGRLGSLQAAAVARNFFSCPPTNG
jgi:hypothetical protein